MLENHLVGDIKEFMNGQTKLRMVICNLAFPVKVSIVPRKWSFHRVFILMILSSNQPFTVKLTVTLLQESKNLEITTGSLIQQSIDLDMEKGEFLTEQLRPWNQRDMKKTSQKPLLLRRRLKISKVFHQTYWVFLGTWDKDKLQDLTTYTVLKTFKVKTHGMQLDAFMGNQLPLRYYPIKILVNRSDQIVEMLWEKKKILIEVSDAQLSERTFHTKISKV